MYIVTKCSLSIMHASLNHVAQVARHHTGTAFPSRPPNSSCTHKQGTPVSGSPAQAVGIDVGDHNAKRAARRIQVGSRQAAWEGMTGLDSSLAGSLSFPSCRTPSCASAQATQNSK